MKRVIALIMTLMMLSACTSNDAEVSLEGENVKMEVDGSSESQVAVSNDEEDSCLEGDWRITNFSDYFEAMVGKATEDIPMGGEISSEDEGDLIISFDGEKMSMSDDQFVVRASMMGITVPVDINATGEVTYEVDGDQIINSGSGEVEVEADPVSGMGYSVDMTNWESSSVTYECSGDSLVWKAGDNFESDITFERL